MYTCSACLDERACWVCLGHGRLDGRHGFVTCHRCHGTGRCPWCQDIGAYPLKWAPAELWHGRFMIKDFSA